MRRRIDSLLRFAGCRRCRGLGDLRADCLVAAMCVRYSHLMTHATLAVNEQGRVTIPAQLRRELGIESGSSLVAYVDDGRLILEPRAYLVARIQREARASLVSGGSVVDELINERRREAVREQAGLAVSR